MFKLAILGPVLSSFGLSRQCTQCHARGPAGGDPSCRGFGAGCLGYGPAVPARASAADFVRFDTRRVTRR